MVKIGWINLPKDKDLLFIERSGGGIYNEILYETFNEYFTLETLGIWGGLLSRYFANNLFRSTKTFNGNDIWLYQVESIILNIKTSNGKKILQFHHIGGEIPTSFIPLNYFLNKIFYKNLKKIDVIVTEAEYWSSHFINKGFSNVKKIYNPFSFDNYSCGETQLQNFKQKYNLVDKPIIYIGNCQKWKGVVDSYNSLKDLDVYLVTSGRKTVNLPTVHLNLSFTEYISLLKSASVVVTMSKFPEGWCRTAHEAMLMKTPVIGSGLGGMGELLNNGKQITSNFTQLRKNVEYVLEHRELGKFGFEYARQKQFSKEYFEKEWIALINSLVDGDK
jgi:glycosyltransferase involved in cell wall biosynthesis